VSVSLPIKRVRGAQRRQSTLTARPCRQSPPNAGTPRAQSVTADTRTTHRPRAPSRTHAQHHSRNFIHQELNKVIKQNWTLAVAAAVGVLALAGCNQRESANETAKDVSEARQDANENVAEEKKEAGEVAMESAEDRAAAEYDVAVAQADGARKVAKEKCETLQGDAQSACKDQAEASYESSKASAQAQLDAAKASGSAAPSGN
jgi:hypothetical protein